MLLQNVIRKQLFGYGTKHSLLMLSEKAFSSKTFSDSPILLENQDFR